MKLHWLKLKMKTDWMFYSQLALRIPFLRGKLPQLL